MTLLSRTPDPGDLLPLTDLAFNVLVSLSDDGQHGYALVKELRSRTGRKGLRTGTVYAALARLQDDGLVEEVDAPNEESDGRRRYYRATSLGIATARAEAQRLVEVLAIARDKALLTTSDA